MNRPANQRRILGGAGQAVPLVPAAETRPAQPTGNRSGLLVCLEGIDGAGKTTAAHEAAALLRDQGHRAVVFDKKYLPAGGSYVRQQLDALGRLIWGHPADDPYLQLGDMYWVYLQAAWYGAASRCLIEPLLAAGHVVVTDTWMHKFFAKLALRPGVDMGRVRAAFADVRPPDLVIRLLVDPQVAADRKRSFGISEAGNHEGQVELSDAAFIAYQTRLAVVLDQWAADGRWASIDANTATPGEVAGAVAEQISRCLTTSELPTAAI